MKVTFALLALLTVSSNCFKVNDKMVLGHLSELAEIDSSFKSDLKQFGSLAQTNHVYEENDNVNIVDNGDGKGPHKTETDVIKVDGKVVKKRPKELQGGAALAQRVKAVDF